jgi:putative hydrolase of the HAD superfamily
MSATQSNSDLAIIRAVVLDLDDTLYPEVEYVRSGFRAVANYLAGADGTLDEHPLFDLMWREFQKGARGRVFNTVLDKIGKKAGTTRPTVSELITLYRKHRPDIQLEVDVRNLLTDLQKRFKMGLLTDGYLPAQKLKVAALGIENHFDHIVYTEELGREHWKPSPVGFEKMAEALDCAHKHCVYVGDNPKKDFIAPNRLGWATIQIESSQGVHSEQAPNAAASPDRILSNFSELTSTFLM